MEDTATIELSLIKSNVIKQEDIPELNNVVLIKDIEKTIDTSLSLIPTLPT